MSGAHRPVLVVKLGSSSVTTAAGNVDTAAVGSICAQIAAIRTGARRVVVVSSGAIAAGWSALGEGRERSKDPAVLQAVSAVGQPLLVQAWIDELARHGLVAGQVLLAPLDFIHRQQYLHARQTLGHLLELGVVPIVNENDAVADDEIRFGDNDRLAALVSNLVGADLMALLTDTPGLFTADPKQVAEASLIEEVIEIDHQLEDGARKALVQGGRSLLAAGVTSVSGRFERDDAVEVLDASGSVVAKGLAQYPASRSAEWVGRRSEQLPDDLSRELIHRDDMVVLGE